MSPERWRQINPLLQAALELDVKGRCAFLDQACADDEALRHEVESIIVAYERADDFLDDPALMVAAKMIAEDQVAQKTLTMNNASPDKQRHNSPVLAPGEILDDRYLIKEELGHGGIGVVFLAHDQKLDDTLVVVKVLRERLCESEHWDWVEKHFRDEMKALARINHPGVVRAHDVGQLPDSRFYLVMDYVPGKSLRSVVEQHGTELRRVGKLLHQIAQALDAAHEQGIIHRDLKPENILLQPSGSEEYVKLIDFGIATVHESLAQTSPHTTQIVVGSVHYMAPEQMDRKPTIASDIYALGVIVYELVTGQKPFNPDTWGQLKELQRAGVRIKPGDLRPDLPVAAEKAILKVLSFNASDRFASASDFSKAFNQALAKPNQPGPFGAIPAALPPRQRTTRGKTRARLWLPPLALLVALLAVVAIGTIAWLSLPFWSRNTPGVTQPKGTATTGHSLSYSLLVQKNLKRHPGSQPFISTGDIGFEAGDQVRLNLSSPQAGYLYVINEGPARTGGLPDYVVMFPNAGGSAQVTANQPIQIPSPSGKPERDWFVFDKEEGVEKIWLIWSERSVAEIEAIKRWANPKDKGVIGNSSQIKSVKQYLDAQSVAVSEVEKDGANKRLEFKSRGEVLIGLVQLKHH